MIKEHPCKYESEISRISTDVDWIKQSLKDIVPKIDTMHTTFTQGEGKIKVLNKAVFGNGKEGLSVKVEKLEKDVVRAKGWIGGFVFLGSCLGAAIGWLLTFLKDKFFGG